MDIVERLYNDTISLDTYLLEQGEISFQVTVDSNLRKSILLASASYFENCITDLVARFAGEASSDERLVNFVQKKALSRQYHTLFSWEAKNCNSFLGLFGETYKKVFAEQIAADEALKQAVIDFLEIGAERNRMVHQDFGAYSLEKTSEEIFNLHKSAKVFIQELSNSLIPA